MKIKILSIFIMCFMVIGAQAQVDRSKQPEAGPAPKINLGKPRMFKLKNGLQVMVVENHKLPRVRASLMIDNMPHAEGKKLGVKSLYSAMMGNGTQSMSKDEYNEKIDFLGANVGFGTESAYASSLSKFFPEVLELMADGLLNPNFSEDEFKDQKDRIIEGLKAGEKSASYIVGNVSDELAYGKNHPYGEFETEETVNKVTLNDVKAYYNNFISPKNAYLVVVGDVNDSDVKKLTKKYLGNWKESTPPSAALPAVPKVQYTQVNFIDVPSAVQSELRVQNTVDLKMSDDDYFPILVANQILGGSFGSYLNMNLREEHGYTYGARSYTGTDKYVSKFTASASVRNAVTDSAIVETLKEINRIKTEKVDFEDLNNAKNKFAGDFVLKLENPSTIANYALNIETNDLPKDFYETFLKRINAVTQEDILRVANKYFKTDAMQIVVAGKGSEVAENLENITYKGKTIPVFYFNKEGEKVEKPEYNKEVPEGMTVNNVYNAYIKAVGGNEAVNKINSIAMTGSASVQGMNISFNMKQTKAGKSAQVVSMNGMTLSKNVFDGKTGYTEAQGQKIDYTEEQIADAKASGGLFPELTVAEGAKLTGIEKVNGKDAYVVQSSEKTKDFYDTESGLKVQTATTVSQAGQTMTNTTGLEDYQEVNGVKFPHVMKVSFGPQEVEMKVNEIKVNEGVSDADFE
ncbi:insulinase family protein [Mesonia aestuariivivens]|uniref:Insulinase family protein n=1 Tax=Mesonia aestuariivivens TaxID=2796128 RepID=A0ABS6VXP8_9FLAO|nr:insulinase family protein [Mesonia aestuariivivens]MBW2960367.1 insulinase family protein [Mesonia aestuariivivens]